MFTVFLATDLIKTAGSDYGHYQNNAVSRYEKTRVVKGIHFVDIRMRETLLENAAFYQKEGPMSLPMHDIAAKRLRTERQEA
jgi:hypothetical protein